MLHQAVLRRIGLGIIALSATLAITVSVADAFTGPGSAGGVGNGAIASDAASNVTIGNNTTLNSTKLAVYASSTANTHYALQALQPNGTSIFYVRNDGAVSIPGALSVGSFTGISSASNISAGAFGANTGGGNYSFPASLALGGATSSARLTLHTGASDRYIDAKDGSGVSKIIFYSYDPVLGTNSIRLSPGDASAYDGNQLMIGTNRIFFGYGTVDFNTGQSAAPGGGVYAGYLAINNAQVRMAYYDNKGVAEFLNSNGSALLRATIADGSNVTANYIDSYYSLTGSGSKILSVRNAEVEKAYIDKDGLISTVAGYRFPDGSIQTIAATGGSATTTAANVSSASFGANTGGGNYTFPANVGIGSTNANARLQLTLSNDDYTNTAGAGSHILMSNPSGSQNVISSYIGATLVAKWRTDNAGNVNWVSGGGYHAFYTGGDFPSGTIRLIVANGGNVGIGNTGPNYKLDVTGDVNFSGALRVGGSAGTSGYVLQSNGASAPAWVATSTLGIGGASTISAANVSSGSFGANTGGGNYTFPAGVTITSATTLTAQTASRALAVDGSKNIVSSFGSASLLDALTDETGSGVNVFGTSPTFTTDIRTPLVIGGTATGSNLILKSTTGVGSGDYVSLRVGNNGATEALRAITNGNIGIATTTPGYPLTVAGTIFSSSGGFRFPDGTTQTTAATGGSTISAPNVSSGSFGANTGGGNYTFPGTLGVTGNVGIGAAAGSERLEVSTAGSTASRIKVMSGTGIAGFEFTTNAYSWYFHHRGANEAPNNRLAFFNNAASEVFTLLSGGNVGVGNSNPTYKLDVSGDLNFTGALRVGGSAGTSGYVLKSNGTSAPSWVATSTLGIGGASTLSAPNISSGAFGANTGGGNYTFPGTLGVTGVITSSGGNANIGAHPTYGSTYAAFWKSSADYSLLTDGTDTFINAPNNTGTIHFRTANNARMTLTGNTLSIGGGTGKLNVGTVDPIYEINGEKFATYMAGMIGVKEEVAGILNLPCVAGTCEKVIDFAREEKGSDLWLFGKTTDIKKHLSQASIMLTPAFDGRVSYRKGDGTLTITATTFTPQSNVEVSYRFTAPRFDAEQWGNTTNDPANGFIIND